MKRKIIDGKRELPFIITKEDVRCAKRKSANFCVIALSLLGTHTDYQRVHVGPKITKVVTATTITRYMTPKALREAIHVFDKTGAWGLPPATYILGAVPPSERLGARSFRANSWVIKGVRKGRVHVQAKGKGSGRVRFNDGRELSARNIRRVESYA